MKNWIYEETVDEMSDSVIQSAINETSIEPVRLELVKCESSVKCYLHVSKQSHEVLDTSCDKLFVRFDKGQAFWMCTTISTVHTATLLGVGEWFVSELKNCKEFRIHTPFENGNVLVKFNTEGLKL